MKIDLSKYPPGTKFKLCNERIVTLVGKSFVDGDYIIEFSNGDLRYRNQEGKLRSGQSEWDIKSVIQPDKYLVSFRRKNATFDSEIVTEPQVLTPEYFLTYLRGTFVLGALGNSIPDKVLSWSKIEE